MKASPHSGAAPRPVAVAIALQMRVAMPKAPQSHPRAPTNVHSALKMAANSSPAAKAAFARAAPAVKAATPHLKALAKQPGKGLLSSLYHGAAALHSLRQVTREMSRESPSAMTSVKTAFKQAAASSPAAGAAFQRAGPATARAQKHVDTLAKLRQQPNPSLLSSLGNGIQALRALRSVTREMQKSASPPSLLSAKSALAQASASSPKAAHAFTKSAPSVARASTHLDALVALRQQPKSSLLSSLGQGFKAMRALRDVTRELGAAPTPAAPETHDVPAPPTRRAGPGASRPMLGVPSPIAGHRAQHGSMGGDDDVVG